jgi:drug/metabolite transporter (DMT)-like permease
MPPLALVLVLTAAACHAGWNVFFKQSGDKGVFSERLLWSAGIALAPLWIHSSATGGGLPAGVWPLVAGSAVAELVYYLLLAAAYRHGALALVYPVARGTGALLTPIWAGLALGERLSLAGGAGVALIGAGLFTMWRGQSRPQAPAAEGAFLLACASGVATSAYSVVDKAALSRAPVGAYLAAVFLLTATLFSIVNRLVRNGASRPRARMGTATAVGLVTAVTYGLVLLAASMARVSYVAAARESSMVFGMALGRIVLGERIGPVTLAGAVMIVAGVTAIALGG